jgi:hypothetical protein
VWLLCPFSRGGNVHQQATVFYSRRERWNFILFKSRLAGSGTPVEFPKVPWAFNEFSIESPVAQRTTDVIANSRDGAKDTIFE